MKIRQFDNTKTSTISITESNIHCGIETLNTVSAVITVNGNNIDINEQYILNNEQHILEFEESNTTTIAWNMSNWDNYTFLTVGYDNTVTPEE